MLGILSKNGYKINLNEEDADIILVNTCSFIKEAEKESVKAIVSIAESGKKAYYYQAVLLKNIKKS